MRTMSLEMWPRIIGVHALIVTPVNLHHEDCEQIAIFRSGDGAAVPAVPIWTHRRQDKDVRGEMNSLRTSRYVQR